MPLGLVCKRSWSAPGSEQQLSALKPRGVVATGVERALADSIWSLCLSLSEAAGFGGKEN